MLAVVQHVVVHSSQLWPTLTRLGTVIGAIAAGAATVYGRRNHNINQRIEVLINGQLHGKLDELAKTTKELRSTAAQLKKVTAERDQALKKNNE